MIDEILIINAKNRSPAISFALMIFLIGIIIVLWLFYTVVIFYYNRFWRQMPICEVEGTDQYTTTFSVVIPARNEEANIGRLLESLRQQTYPRHLFEVIVVDDHSTDQTAAIVRQFSEVQLVQLKADGINSYKKKAIETGIAVALNEWIVCTDADCLANPKWLQVFAAYIEEKNPVFIAAPVCLIPQGYPKVERGGGLFVFQALDFLTLQGITAASVFSKKHNMCNGANLAYQKKVFNEVEGFRGIDNIASGDDMLLMHKIWKHYPEKIGYIKSSDIIIKTEAAPTWKAFFNQRIRWASKATSYDDKRIFVVLLLVYLFNLSYLVLAVAAVFSLYAFVALIVLLILKTMVEYSFVSSVSRFFKLQHLRKYFFFFQPVHIAYTIIAGFFGSFGKYEWKGRNVK